VREYQPVAGAEVADAQLIRENPEQ
jgi:hypothetical protein